MMMKFRFSSPALVVPTLVALSMVLSACGTSGGGRGLTSLRGSSSSAKPESSLLSSLGNGLLGNTANQLSAADRTKALEAEYRALEYSPAGKAVSWSAGSNSGDVTAAQPYQVGSQNCRQYSHTFDIGGSQQTVRGTACRNTDGSWTPLT